MSDLRPQADIDAAIAKETPDLSADRKREIVHHIQVCRPERRGELLKVLSEILQGAELEFFQQIVIEPPDENAGAVAAAQPTPPGPTPETNITARTEGDTAAKSESTRSRGR